MEIRLPKDSEPANIIIHLEIFLDISQTYKIQTRSTCIIKNDAVLYGGSGREERGEIR